MNENELKEAWRKGGMELERNGCGGIFCDSSRLTPLEKLTRRYKRFSIIGALCIVLGLTWLNFPEIQMKNRVIIAVIYSVIMFVCSITDRYLYVRLSSINISSTPTAEVIETVRKCRKIHLIFICFSIPLVLAFMGFIGWELSGNIFILIGIIVGVIAGLTIGIFQLLEFLRDYRDILTD